MVWSGLKESCSLSAPLDFLVSHYRRVDLGKEILSAQGPDRKPDSIQKIQMKRFNKGTVYGAVNKVKRINKRC